MDAAANADVCVLCGSTMPYLYVAGELFLAQTSLARRDFGVEEYESVLGPYRLCSGGWAIAGAWFFIPI